MYLNAYVPSLQTGGGFVWFVKTQLGALVPSTMMVAPISQPFVAAMTRFAETEGVALLANRDGVADAVHDPRRFVAHMGLMNAAQLSGDRRQIDDFAERRVGARYIEQARAQAEGAVAHGLPHEVAHPLELLGRSGTIDWPDDLPTYRSMADEGAHVDGWFRGRHACKIRGDISRAAAISIGEHGGHALAHVVLGRGIADRILSIVACFGM
jgi:hypothetical protein